MLVNSSHHLRGHSAFIAIPCPFYLLKHPNKIDEIREKVLQKTLGEAIRHNQIWRAKAAVLQGAPINRQDIYAGDGHNDYHIVRCSYNKCNEIAKILIENNVDLNVTCEHGHSPIIIVAGRRNYELAEAFIKAGADVNHKDNDGLTALMEACKSHDDKMISLLIEAGADVQTVDHSGNNALLYAIRDGFIGFLRHSLDNSSFLLCMKNLIARSAIDFSDSEGNTALMIAVERGLFDLIELLLDANPDREIKNKLGLNALDIAVAETKSRKDRAKNYAEIIELLKEKELSTHFKININTVVHHPRLISAAYSNDLEEVELYLKEGDDADQQDLHAKNTALHVAASQGHASIVKVLIEAKANVHIKNHFKETALEGALWKQQNNHEEIEKYNYVALQLYQSETIQESNAARYSNLE